MKTYYISIKFDLAFAVQLMQKLEIVHGKVQSVSTSTSLRLGRHEVNTIPPKYSHSGDRFSKVLPYITHHPLNIIIPNLMRTPTYFLLALLGISASLFVLPFI